MNPVMESRVIQWLNEETENEEVIQSESDNGEEEVEPHTDEVLTSQWSSNQKTDTNGKNRQMLSVLSSPKSVYEKVV